RADGLRTKGADRNVSQSANPTAPPSRRAPERGLSLRQSENDLRAAWPSVSRQFRRWEPGLRVVISGPVAVAATGACRAFRWHSAGGKALPLPVDSKKCSPGYRDRREYPPGAD